MKEDQRLCVFPIVNKDFWNHYLKQRASVWYPEEVDLSSDKFDELKPDEQKFLKMILAFFASSDVIVNMNLDLNFTKEIDILEVNLNYHYQTFIEDIHSITYATLIDTYIKNSDEKKYLFEAVQTIPCIKNKADWAFKWIESQHQVPFVKRLLAFAIVEGVYFSGSFCAIHWLAQQNKMPGLCKSNEFIARDEGMHTDFACMLYKYLGGNLSEEEVHTMMREAVAIEQEFITVSLPCSLLGMNSELMGQYIRFVADRLVVNLGYNKIFGDKNPFPFMENLSLEGKNNFFESRTTEYQKANVLNVSKQIFEVNEDF